MFARLARVWLAALIALSLAFGPGCKKKGPKADTTPTTGSAPAPNAVPKATLTPDTKPVAALLADPELMTGALVGTKVKVHGYAVVMSPSKVAVTAEADVSVPFIACLGSGLPAGIAARAHVLAEGRIDPTGQIAECRISPL
jgi:hypothetical protein